MRMLPTVSGLSRRTSVEMTLEGYKLPRSTSVIYWAVSNLTSEEHFFKAKEFLPERWLRDTCAKGSKFASATASASAKSSKSPHSHVRLPFGHGPRMCVGRR